MMIACVNQSYRREKAQSEALIGLYRTAFKSDINPDQFNRMVIACGEIIAREKMGELFTQLQRLLTRTEWAVIRGKYGLNGCGKMTTEDLMSKQRLSKNAILMAHADGLARIRVNQEAIIKTLLE